MRTKTKEKWYFTFGSGQVHDGCYIVFFGTFSTTRKEMFNRFDHKWSFQYSEEQWNNPSKSSLKYKGLDDGKPHTLAEVWGMKEI